MPADYCGAFSIDSIDQFGTLEQILVSFDDPIWNSANTCIVYGDGSVTANASASANGIRTRQGAGSVTANGTVVSSAIRTRTSSGSISATGTAVAEGLRVRLGTGSILGTATVSCVGGVEFEGTGFIECFATVTASPVAIYSAVATVNGITLVNCFGRVLGDNWTDETAGTEAWTGVSPSATVWTVASAGSETWTGTTPTVTTWSNISSGNSQWQ